MGGKWSAVLLDVLLCCFRDAVPEVRASALSAVPHAVLALIQAAMKSTSPPAAAPGGDHSNGKTPSSTTATTKATTTARDQTISKLFISLIPAVCSMQKDTSIIVRIALCSTIGHVLSLLYSITLTGYLHSYSFISSLQATLSSIVLTLLDDKTNQVAIQMVTVLCLTIEKEYSSGTGGGGGGDHLMSSSYLTLIFIEENLFLLIRCVKYLSKLPNWRVRKLICVMVPKLVNTCQTVENRSLVSDIIIPLLYDPIFAVRQAAATAMCIASMSDYYNDNSTTTGGGGGDRSVATNRNGVSDGDDQEPPLASPPPSSPYQSLKEMKSTIQRKIRRKEKPKSSSRSSGKQYEEEQHVTSNGEPVQDMGRMWLDCVVLPQLESLRTSKIFSNRILSLHMIATLLFEEIVQRGDVRYHILINIALTLSHDPVANVRIALGEVLGVLAQLLKQDHDDGSVTSPTSPQQQQQQIWEITMNTLSLLSNDGDKDVRYNAKKAKEYLQTTGKIHQAKTKISLIAQRKEG
jgi:hypothetical protein